MNSVPHRAWVLATCTAVTFLYSMSLTAVNVSLPQIQGALSATLGVPGSTLSFHLKELMHAGLVTQERDGRNLLYRPSIKQMNALLDYLTAHCCSGAACDASTPTDCSTC